LNNIFSVASEARKDSERASVQLLLVNYERDIMCFMVMDPMSKMSQPLSVFLDSYVPFPAALKLHSTSYTILEGISNVESLFPNINTPLDLTMVFQKEYFHLANDAEFIADASKDYKIHFANLLQKIADYTEKPFDSFFWSSAATQKFFSQSNGDELMIRDQERGALWSFAAEQFHNYIDDKVLAGQDICRFKQLRDETSIEEA